MRRLDMYCCVCGESEYQFSYPLQKKVRVRHPKNTTSIICSACIARAKKEE
jgi:hypothetical protein